VEEGYEAKRGNIKELAEALSIIKFKTTGTRRPPRRLGAPGSKLAIEAGKPSPKAPAFVIESAGEQATCIKHKIPAYLGKILRVRVTCGI
jgi:hypothetical protein